MCIRCSIGIPEILSRVVDLEVETELFAYCYTEPMKSGVLSAREDWLSGYESKKDYRDHSKQTRRMFYSTASLSSDVPTGSFVFDSAQKEGASRSPGKPKTQARSRASISSGSRRGRMATIPQVEALPDRVNAIRDGALATVAPPAGHFVREHRRSNELSEANEPESEDGDTIVNLKYQRMPDGRRRSSLDYDELEAVKQRVAQAAALALKPERQSIDEEDEDASPLPEVLIEKGGKSVRSCSVSGCENEIQEQTPSRSKKWFSSFRRLVVKSK